MSSKEFWELVEELGGGPAVFTGVIIAVGVLVLVFYMVAKAILF